MLLSTANKSARKVPSPGIWFLRARREQWGGAQENALSLKHNFCFILRNTGVYVYILIYRREYTAGGAPLVSAQWSRPMCVGASGSPLCVRRSS